MRKKMEICGKEYDICSNAFTMFLYKKEFKTGIMADIGRLQEFAEIQEKVTKDKKGKTVEEIQKEVGLALMSEIDTYIEVTLRIAYVFIKCANPSFMPFDEWLQTIEGFNFEDKWVSEVTELAVNSFCGSGVGGTTEITQK